MKKILLVSALAIAAMANANGFDAPRKNLAVDAQKIEAQVTPFEWKEAKTLLKEHDAVRAPKAASYDWADWYYAPGAFYLGIYEGIGAYNLGMMLFPYMDSVVYYNYYGPADWKVNGNVYEENSDEFVTGYGVNGLYYVPETTDHEFNPRRDWGENYKDTTLHLKGTLYGNGTGGQYICSAIEAKFLNDENIHMTLCAMQTDIYNEPDAEGNDFWRVGGGATGDPYFNGTGVHLAEGDENTADTLGIIVDNRGTMKIEEILIPIYSDNKSDVTGVIPNGAELHLALFPLDEKGIHFGDTIASTVITNADFIGNAASWGMYGTLHAKFYETDIFGTESQVPVWVNGSFYLQLTNFNETGCDFGIFSDYDCPTTATTVYQHDGLFSFRAGRNSGGGNYGQNLGISFDAYFPTLINDTTVNTLYVGVENESVAHYGDDEEDYVVWLLSNFNYEEWTIEGDEWITAYLASTDYWEDYGAIALVFEAEALPEGEKGRKGTVIFEADGAVQEFTFIQGDVPTEDIENTKVDVKFDNKTYNVLGVEVNDDFKGVVIKNGKKFVR